jgi:deoxyadenosine/deoxycytidine kinase
MSNKRPLIIAIEGNIGAGKSTLLKHLEDAFGVRAAFMPEPVDIWTTIKDENGEHILSKFYAEPHKYAFSFQIMAYSTRLAMLRKTIEEHPDCDIIICERSLEADSHIFAKMLFEDGMIEYINYQVYRRLYADTSANYVMDGVVYLDASAETCMERVQKRSREGESKISLEYLEKCRKYYDAWLNADGNCECLTIDANTDVAYENDEGNLWILQIFRFVETIKRGRDRRELAVIM